MALSSLTVGQHRRVLLIPGIDNNDARHWQTLWERDFPDSYRSNLGQ